MRKLRSVLLLAVLQMPLVVFAEQSTNDVVLVALSPMDNKAIVRLPSNNMQVLQPGDTIQGTRFKLIQVLTNKLLLNINDSKQIVWMHKAVNGYSAVEYPEMLN